MREFWIADIRISDAVEHKLRTRRGFTGDDVREACVPDTYRRAGWEVHPEHGRRLLVVGDTHAGLRMKVVLAPVDVDDGIWRLCTAMRESGDRG